MGQQQFGYRCMRVDSELTDLEVLYDFITEIDGMTVVKEITIENFISKQINSRIFQKIDTNNEDLDLTVYSIKTESVRNIKVKICSSDLLPNSIFCYYPIFDSIECFVQIWDVLADSPASKAGLKPYVHYVLNTNLNESLFFDSADFSLYINDSEQSKCEFYVYDYENENVEMISIIPNEIWCLKMKNVDKKVLNEKNFIKSIGCSIRYVPLPGLLKENKRLRM
jgi:hypothetical protein